MQAIDLRELIGEDESSRMLFLTDKTITISGRIISGSGNTVRGSNNRILGDENRAVGSNNLLFGNHCVAEGEGNMIVRKQGTRRWKRTRRRRVLVLPPKRGTSLGFGKPAFRKIQDAKGTPVQGDDDGCVICFENRKDILLRPCKHIRMCGPCARKSVRCPECRQRIRGAELVYT